MAESIGLFSIFGSGELASLLLSDRATCISGHLEIVGNNKSATLQIPSPSGATKMVISNMYSYSRDRSGADGDELAQISPIIGAVTAGANFYAPAVGTINSIGIISIAIDASKQLTKTLGTASNASACAVFAITVIFIV